MNGGTSKTISVKDILQQCSGWGVPHFQRGSVWSTDNVSRLLESLYHDTPCGSIILWKQHRTEFGVPLVSDGKKAGFGYLIVDGQQRTRSLVAAFDGCRLDWGKAGNDRPAPGIQSGENAATETDVEENGSPAVDNQSEGSTRKYWSINLDRVPEFREILNPEAKALQAPLFVLVEDLVEFNAWKARRQEEAVSKGKKPQVLFNKPHINRSLPLKLFFGNEDALIEALQARLAQNKKVDSTGVDISKAVDALRRRINGMADRRFFVSTLRTGSLSEVIDVFIRINSGGRPVDEEERAYSQLLRVYDGRSGARKSGADGEPRTADGWINEIFQCVHGGLNSDDGKTDLAERDQMLARANERSIGFKFFLRTFILAASYHARAGISRKAFSFNVLYEPDFLGAISDGKDKVVWRETRDVVVAIAELLRTELHLDSFVFLPGARVLWPVMMALVRFPGMMDGRGTREARVRDGYRKALAHVILKLILSNPADRWLLEQVVFTAGVRTSAKDCIDGLVQAVEFKRFDSMLDEALKESNSLLSTPVLILYGLERSRGARDFSYGNYYFKNHELFKRAPRPIDRNCGPEKQHIVPYSLLTQAYGVDSGGRVSSHPINNIGNLTYLSHDMNGLDGLGSTPLDFTGEEQGNLDAHCLGADSLGIYREIQPLLNWDMSIGANKECLKNLFEKWTFARRQDIRRGFVAWLNALKLGWVDSDARKGDGMSRIEPEAPKLMGAAGSADLEYLIRQIDLDNRIEDELITLFGDFGWHLAGSDKSSITLYWKHRNRQWIKKVRLDKQGLAADINGIPQAVQFEPGLGVTAAFGEFVRQIQKCQQEAKDYAHRKDEEKEARKAGIPPTSDLTPT
ncbi:MAG TPA: DUF262 domain-containing protein [Myxococcota bacterium]|nr:DUF262 domain-containing protein [Myxococcota bacterium]HOH76580.1 DUF262 domain-containing protein [Myxococcota bacterium]HPV04966.1 DUF262 domain-containing protein [Myxococcota bacterium]